MTNKTHSGRDIRLLIAILLFVVSLISGSVQAWILHLYIEAIILRDWDQFSQLFSVEAPAFGPDVFCFGRCVANLPFLPGWIGIMSFLLGLVVLFWSWWKPWSSQSGPK